MDTRPSQPLIERLLGANWRTTLSGTGAAIMTALAFLAAVPNELGDVAKIIPPESKAEIFKASLAAAFILKVIHSVNCKDKNVSGTGAVLDPHRVNDGIAAPRTIPVSALMLFVGLSFFFLTGCGTPFGIGVAGIIDSAPNKAIVGGAAAFGTQIGLGLIESKGGVTSDATVQQFNATVSGGASNLTSSGLDWVAALLRQQQGTANPASATVLAGAMQNGGVPQAIAKGVADIAGQNIAKIAASTGVSTDVANEAVASALNAAAAVKKNPAAATPVPTQAVLPRHHSPRLATQFRNTPPALRTLYTPDNQPVYPLIVTREKN